MRSMSFLSDPCDTLFDSSIERMISRIRQTTESQIEAFPHYADVTTGTWETTDDGFWTGGFWPGILWLAGYYSGEKSFWKEAERWTGRLESRVDSDSVFRGFLFYFAGSVGSEIASSKLAEDLARRAARNLKSTFNPHIGLMPLGKSAEEAHTVGEGETNIDSISASLVIAWAAENADDE
ncbi:hypothetical protein, partial [Chromohalobacter japonicus]